MQDLIQGLSRVLDVASQRQVIIASNMANIDTPGYRTKDIDDFGGALRQALEGDGLKSPVNEVGELLERPDGNNVSIDREALAMSDTQLRYRTAAQMLRSQFHLLSTAIGGGSQ